MKVSASGINLAKTLLNYMQQAKYGIYGSKIRRKQSAPLPIKRPKTGGLKS